MSARLRRHAVDLEARVGRGHLQHRDPVDDEAVTRAPPLDGLVALEGGALRLADDVAPRGRDALLDRTPRRVVGGRHEGPGDQRRAVDHLRLRSRARLQPGRGHVTGHEHRVGEDPDELVAVGGHAVDPGPAERGDEHPDRLLAVRGPRHHLGEHRVVEGGDLVARGEAAVDAHPRAAEQGEPGVGREVEGDQPTALGDVRRVLGVEPHLDRVAGRRRASDLEVQPLGHGQLELDEVDPLHQLGDGVLDLEAGVHLEEVEPVGHRVVEELDRPGTAVADVARELFGRLAHRGLGGCRKSGRRSLLDHLLVAPLHRAVAGAERDGAGLVRDDLHLDVAAGLDIGLDEDGAVAESAQRLRRGCLDLGRQPVEGAYDTHPAATAACGRLHQQRQVGVGGVDRRREDGHAGLLGDLLGADLVAHDLDRLGRRTDPGEPGVDDGAGEVGVLRQEAVSRVDRVGTRLPRGCDHEVGAEVGVGGRVAREAYGVVSLGDVGQPGVRVGVDGHGLDAEPPTGGEDPAGDLAAVGHEQSLDHGVSFTS